MPAVTTAIIAHGWPAETIFEDIENALKIKSTREFVAGQLFPIHISIFSRSRRKVPIYLQIATPSSNYSVWMYVHALTSDTIFRVQNELLEPKLLHEERKLEALYGEIRDKVTAAERKVLTAQAVYVEGLRVFLEEVKRVAPLWCPNPVADTLEAAYGENWWQSDRIPQNVKSEVTSRIQKEIDSGVTPRSLDELDYTTFGELSAIIISNWDVFGGAVRQPQGGRKGYGQSQHARGPIAHCTALAQDEVVRLRLTVVDWFRLIK